MARPARSAPAPQTTRRRVPWPGIIGAVVVIGGIGALVALDPAPPGVEFPSLGNTHLETILDPHIAYNSSPPSSGPHVGALAQWGVAETPIPPELFIHNLEDGGVVLAYDCSTDCAGLEGELASFVEERRGRVLLTRHDGITDETGARRAAAAVAWTRVFYFDDFSDDNQGEVEVFLRLYEGLDHHVAG